jgi:hypothetical protein
MKSGMFAGEGQQQFNRLTDRHHKNYIKIPVAKFTCNANYDRDK